MTRIEEEIKIVSIRKIVVAIICVISLTVRIVANHRYDLEAIVAIHITNSKTSVRLAQIDIDAI